MKNAIFLLLIFICMSAFSQSSSSEKSPKQFVEDFFEAFHKQDTVTLKNMADANTILQSVAMDTEGNTVLTTEDYSKFLKSIGSIPANTKFEERLNDFRVEENGLLTTVTTPYTFYFNGNLSHCGVNSFSLVKFEGNWKIVYLIDTRKKVNCE